MLELGGKITVDGKLMVYDQQALNQWRLSNSGKDVILSLKLQRKSRSSKQNAYYWGVVIPIVRDAINSYGNEFSATDVHDFLKAKFNSKEIETVPDNFIEVPQSTSVLDTGGFMNYIETIQRFASTMLGVYVPGPNEQMHLGI